MIKQGGTKETDAIYQNRVLSDWIGPNAVRWYTSVENKTSTDLLDLGLIFSDGILRLK
jgi:hypothetical protein